MTTKTVRPQEIHDKQTTPPGGMPVRTDLHAGNACWDQVNLDAAKLWNKVAGLASSAANSFTNHTPTTPA